MRFILLGLMVTSGCADVRRCEFDRNCLGGELCVAGRCEIAPAGRGPVVGDGGIGVLSDCRNAQGCAAWLECEPSESGGRCVSAEFLISWTTPASAETEVAASDVDGEVSVRKRDGGTVHLTSIPVAGAEGGAFVGSNGRYTGRLLLPAPDGKRSFEAGWAPMGPASTVSVERNVDPPRLSIDAIPPAPMGDFDGGFDTRVPGGPAYRKDAVMTVRVRSSDLDTLGASIELRAQVDGGAVTVLNNSSDCSTLNVDVCSSFRVDLRTVAMSAFRADVQFTAVGRDRAGNTGATITSVTAPVTRFNWAKFTGGQILSSPAISAGGRIIVGNALGVVGLNADGTEFWNSPVGPVVAAPAIGVDGAGNEYLFVHRNGLSGVWPGVILSSTIGAVTHYSILPPAANSGWISRAGVVTVGNGSSAVGVVGLQAGDPLYGGGLVGRLAMANGGVSGAPQAGLNMATGNMVANSTSVFFLDTDANLKSLRFDLPTSTIRNEGTVASLGAGTGELSGLAMLTPTRVVGAGPAIRRLFTYDVDGGSAWTAPPSLGFSTSGPVVGSGAIFAVTEGSVGVRLIRANATTGALEQERMLPRAVLDSRGAPTPALGADGRVYVVDAIGTLFVVDRSFDSDGGVEWSAPMPLPFGASVRASPTLDCSRTLQATSGVIYIATEAGWLVSYIVDARGLDSTATWPKYARDARNSGNIDGPAIACP